MREIPLSRGKVAIVDDDDYEWLNQWNWYACKSAHSEHWVACRNTSRKNPPKRLIKMHRLIMGLDFGDKREVDHINCNPLDNRRSNLRLAERNENMRNRRVTTKNTSGLKGVRFFKRDSNWQARITVNYKEIHLGYFATPEEAYAAYCEAAKTHHGEFARTE